MEWNKKIWILEHFVATMPLKSCLSGEFDLYEDRREGGLGPKPNQLVGESKQRHINKVFKVVCLLTRFSEEQVFILFIFLWLTFKRVLACCIKGKINFYLEDVKNDHMCVVYPSKTHWQLNFTHISIYMIILRIYPLEYRTLKGDLW